MLVSISTFTSVKKHLFRLQEVFLSLMWPSHSAPLLWWRGRHRGNVFPCYRVDECECNSVWKSVGCHSLGFDPVCQTVKGLFVRYMWGELQHAVAVKPTKLEWKELAKGMVAPKCKTQKQSRKHNSVSETETAKLWQLAVIFYESLLCFALHAHHK